MVKVQYSASCRNPVIEDLLACEVENAQGDIFTAGILYVQDAGGRVCGYCTFTITGCSSNSAV